MCINTQGREQAKMKKILTPLLAFALCFQIVAISVPIKAADGNKGYCCDGSPCNTNNCGEFTCPPPVPGYEGYYLPRNGNCGSTVGQCCDMDNYCVMAHYCNIQT